MPPQDVSYWSAWQCSCLLHSTQHCAVLPDPCSPPQRNCTAPLTSSRGAGCGILRCGALCAEGTACWLCTTCVSLCDTLPEEVTQLGKSPIGTRSPWLAPIRVSHPPA